MNETVQKVLALIIAVAFVVLGVVLKIVFEKNPSTQLVFPYMLVLIASAIVFAILVAITPAFSANWKWWLLGTVVLLILYWINSDVFPWLISIGSFFAANKSTILITIILLGLGVFGFWNLNKRVKDGQQQLDNLVKTQPFGIQTACDLRNSDPASRIGILLPIQTMLTSLTKGVPAGDVTDADIAVILRVTSEPFMCDTSEVPLLQRLTEIIHRLRSIAYELPDRLFPQTKLALRTIARQLLGEINSPVDTSHLVAYEEIVRHANQWPLEELTETIRERLREIGCKSLFMEAFPEGKRIPHAYGSVAIDPERDHHRVWKRVWPTRFEGKWGSIRCTRADGTTCEGGELYEISLCGCYCGKCMLPNPGPTEDRYVHISLPVDNGMELQFTFIGRVIVHPEMFRDDGERIKPGFGIELHTLEKGHKDDWAIFIYRQNELDPSKKPPEAPF